MLIEDAATDPVGCRVPAREALGIGAFVGVPLCLADGSVWGTLCALGPRAAALGPETVQVLQVLARFVATDIDRSRAEARLRENDRRLRESEANYRTVVEQIPAVVYRLAADAERTARYVSPRAADLLGLPPAAAMPRRSAWMERVHPEDRARVAAAAAASAASGEPFRAEYRVRRGDGGEAWLRDECVPLRDEAGRVVAWHGVLFDVGAQHRLQDELRAARDAAEGASRLKSAFLSTMSHELRTPLTAIVGYAGLLHEGMSGPLTPEQAADVAAIAGGADRLLGLVNDVLDLSRIEAGMLVLELAPEPVALAEVVAAARADVAPQAAAKGLAVVAEVPAGLPPVRADRRRLRQVLLNLVGNAVKFTERGHVRVTARAVEVAAAAAAVEIEVADTGIGIAPEALPHVFDEFRQADDTVTRRYGGSGLGLAISKRLVDLHGGSIRVESTPGAGSVFTLRLPAA